MTELNKKSAELIFAGNSLGNPEDIPARSLAALRESDLVVFEEAKIARQCLKAAGIHREFLLYNEHDQRDVLEEIESSLKNNQTVCYMSDQGMPNIADPGTKLLQIGYHLKAKISVIPGPTSISAALAACPFSIEPHLYCGFLPRDKTDRLDALKKISRERMAKVILDTPYRLAALLEDIQKVFPKETETLLALNISGANEKFIYTNVGQLPNKVDAACKLNFVLIIN